jgi:nucleotide-binding universal stress UspA family protein
MPTVPAMDILNAVELNMAWRNTMRVIFVPVADRPECVLALNTAFMLAHSVGANVIGCHIRPHKDSPVSLHAELSKSGGDSDEAEWQLVARPENGKTAEAAAGKLFFRLATEHGFDLVRRPRKSPGAVWMEKTGAPGKVIAIQGPVSDLLVVSRPAGDGGHIARVFLSAALFRSARPVLVLPQTGSSEVGRRIGIAWNQSTEAASAVKAAMPLLLQADAVTIFSSGPETLVGPSSRQLATYLKYWGVRSEQVFRRGRDEHEGMLDMFRSADCDLLVMGAYSRNRMSQMIFGGMTRFMLEKADIPVFMLHS